MGYQAIHYLNIVTILASTSSKMCEGSVSTLRACRVDKSRTRG